MNTLEYRNSAFERILEVMDKLREKCPWDKIQTNESIRTLTIEEVYELSEAVMNNNPEEIKKELGDLFLHIIFYSKIASEKNQFDIADVMEALEKKLIYRHPHVFGENNADTPEQVSKNWEELKLKENKEKTEKSGVLSGIPKNMPAMIKALRMQQKARGVGFDWDYKEQVWDKVQEEITELQHEIKTMNKEKAEKEFGDIFFALINAARLYDINPENALELTNRKFESRFNYLEENTLKIGKSLKDMTLEEMEKLWNEAKKFEN